ncbi:U-box domain-containing protein 34-like [Cynara cardunculus var. scolymus]|uniref:U-box domain-containing protein 34-like n=1 Tax=Cynara cardunculus var. scolymus TaxID=59895 RepID=UPI000D62F383|nr:U-box domain-containing protein 34-like [Cynara cardunculus var. scolymus]
MKGIKPPMLHGSLCWAMKKAQEKSGCSINKDVEMVCGCTLFDRILDEVFQAELRVAPISYKLRRKAKSDTGDKLNASVWIRKDKTTYTGAKPDWPPVGDRAVLRSVKGIAGGGQTTMDGIGGAITTAIAIDKDKNSQYAVKWALENVVQKMSCVALLHVVTQTTLPHDAGMGKDGRPPTQDEMQQFFHPFRAFCARKGVRTKEVVLQDSDVPSAIVLYIIRNAISHLVVGSPSRTGLTRAFRSSSDVASNLQRSLPDTCNLYVVSKKKNQKMKSATQTPTSNTFFVSTKATQSSLGETDFRSKSDSRARFRRSSFARTTGRRLDYSDFMLTVPRDEFSESTTPPGEFETSPNNQLHGQITQRPSLDGRSDLRGFGPLGSKANMSYEILDKSRILDASGLSISSQNAELDDEIWRLELELKRTMDTYHSACKEAANATQKATEINQQMSAEGYLKSEEAKAAEAALRAIVEMEKQKSKAAIEAAEMAKRLAELETQKRRKAELKAEHEEAERKNLMVRLTQCTIQYRKYSIEDIEIATDYFSNSLKIGEGGYGPVFRAYLDHIAVAIKVLRPDISQGQIQFQKEVEVLSCMRHPHMVLLFGACPEYGCLIYEYMENGSLEDRLFRKSNTPPIPWRVRFKICVEIATALHFLHQTRPQPLVHRDLKPGNILLDRNYVSKISDVGLARLVPPEVADDATQYHMTAAAGTFCYIDPEYQQTGLLGTKSDIYSFGVILLQIITAKSPMGLTHLVSRAIKEGNLLNVLDQAVTDWPLDDTQSLAKMALQCCELRKKDRPDLGSVILPELKRLKDLGANNTKLDTTSLIFSTVTRQQSGDMSHMPPYAPY